MCERSLNVGMFIIPEVLAKDAQRSLQHLPGFITMALREFHHSQVLKEDGDVGMIGSEGRLVDRQPTSYKGLSFRETACALKQLRQIIEVSSNVGVFGDMGRFADLHGSSHQHLGLEKGVCGSLIYLGGIDANIR